MRSWPTPGYFGRVEDVVEECRAFQRLPLTPPGGGVRLRLQAPQLMHSDVIIVAMRRRDSARRGEGQSHVVAAEAHGARRRDALADGRMLAPTHLPPDRRKRHEAAGEWPGASFSSLLDARAADAGDRIYCIAGSRAGGRTYTFGDLKRRADRMAIALGARRPARRRVVVPA
jgi:hypothetical protein